MTSLRPYLTVFRMRFALMLQYPGTTGALRSTTSSTLSPVVGMKTRSVLRMSLIAAAGLIWMGPSQLTAFPSADAVVT